MMTNTEGLANLNFKALVDRMMGYAPPDKQCTLCGQIVSGLAIDKYGWCIECELKLVLTGELLYKSGMAQKWKEATWEKSDPILVAPKILEEIRSWAWSPREKGLYLYGPTGTGKTHLAACLANDQIRNHHRRTIWLNVPQVLKALKAEFGSDYKPMQHLLLAAEKVPLLVLDDLGAEQATEWVQGQLLPILDARLGGRLPNIITTNLAIDPQRTTKAFPDTLAARLGNRITDRIIEGCRLVPVFGANLRIKGAKNGTR